jgi:hypothetical protein
MNHHIHPSAFLLVLPCLLLTPVVATEYHVSTTGNDTSPGSAAAPFRTIQRAANAAQPSDVITVHEGVYRERINPPRGGTSDAKRIVYQAAPGEKVEIKGSEVVKGWTKVEGDVWKATLPKSFFGHVNPFKELIHGDWFTPKNREHHTGAVYLNGDWLTEAVSLAEVMLPAGEFPEWMKDGFLFNLAWLQPEGGERVLAARFNSEHGTQASPCSEGDKCIGFINNGDWLRYEQVNLGDSCEKIEFRAATPTTGGEMEIRLDSPTGDLIGTCRVAQTGDWQKWNTFTAPIKRLSGKHTLCLVFKGGTVNRENLEQRGINPNLWFAQVEKSGATTIHARFPGVDPNAELVEVNARRSVFYPDQPARNFITVRGFTMRHAATPWAPPTAEQIGLIGTHWSKGWIIENNVISHSVCVGISLGKHGDEFDNTSADSAEGYVETIRRAHVHPFPWSKETIGSHIVRDNHISYCEQAGIVGSLGCSFSTITGNTIHDIHIRQLFSGAEQAGIKFHAAIDTEISRNHVYRTTRGLWLDWMAQGTRVTQNLFHDNGSEDLFVEVNHGPFVVDNNLFLSSGSLQDWSQGGSYVHNLMAGRISASPQGRETPFHPAHSTVVAGLRNIQGGDNRFFNNLFVGNGYGLGVYDGCALPLQTGGNVYLNDARPHKNERDALVMTEKVELPHMVEDSGKWTLHFSMPAGLAKAVTQMVTTETLGQACIPKLPYQDTDGSQLKVNIDFFGKTRDSTPTAGPFENVDSGTRNFTVWPLN